MKTDNNSARDNNNIFNLNNSELRARPSGKPSNQFSLNKSDIADDRKRQMDPVLKYPFGTDLTSLKSKLIQKEYFSEEINQEDPARQRGIRVRADNILRNLVDEPMLKTDDGQSNMTNKFIIRSNRGDDNDKKNNLEILGDKHKGLSKDASNGGKTRNEFGLYSNRMETLGKIEKKNNSTAAANRNLASLGDKSSLREALQRRIQAKSNEVSKTLF